MPIGQITVTRNGNNVTPTSLNPDTGALVVGPANNGDVFLVSIINPQYGNYQYISMQSLINNFIVAYVGTDIK